MQREECRKCAGAYFRYVDWSENPTPYDPPTPQASRKEINQQNAQKDNKDGKENGKGQKSKQKNPKEEAFSQAPEKNNKKINEKNKDPPQKKEKKNHKNTKHESQEGQPNLPLTLVNIGIQDDPEVRDTRIKKHNIKKSNENKNSAIIRTTAVQNSDQVQNHLPKSTNKLAAKEQTHPLETRNQPYFDRSGEPHKQTSLENLSKKQVPGQAGEMPLKELTELEEEEEKNLKPGALNSKDRNEVEVNEMWLKIQTERYMQESTLPLAPRCWWQTRLQIKHFIQKCLNPLDTLRALKNKEDDHGPEGETVEWGSRSKRAWGCGCPGLPCICHLQPKREYKGVPWGCCLGLRKGRLIESLQLRVRAEEKLHDKLAQLPPPSDESPAPLFCFGLERCVGQQALSPQLIEAAERTREAADARALCDPQCRARCTIRYDDTVRMLRRQTALEVLRDQDRLRMGTATGAITGAASGAATGAATASGAAAVDGAAVAPVMRPCACKAAQARDAIAKAKEAASLVPASVRGTVPVKDIENMMKRCALLKINKPFTTKIVCYRMEEVRPTRATKTGERYACPPPPMPPPAPLSVLQSSEGGETGQRRRRPGQPTRRRLQKMVVEEVLEQVQEGWDVAAASGQPTGGDAELRPPSPLATSPAAPPTAPPAALSAKPPAPGVNATQSTTEITPSFAIKNRNMKNHRRKTKWELYKEKYKRIQCSLKEVTNALAPRSSAWYFNNLKYWFCSCFSTTRTDIINETSVRNPQEEELYLNLVQLIQEEERFQNVLMLKNYLVNNATLVNQ